MAVFPINLRMRKLTDVGKFNVSKRGNTIDGNIDIDVILLMVKYFRWRPVVLKLLFAFSWEQI